MGQLGNDYAAAIAFNRFGLGGRPDDAIPDDKIAYLLGQLQGPDPMPQGGLPTRAECMQLIEAYLATKDGTQARKAAGAAINAVYAEEVQAQLSFAVTTPAPFRERLVWFWANHFALLTSSIGACATAGVFVREAIRPYVNGNFTDMFLAVMTHPGMIYSLNNNASVGPDSPYAQRMLRQKHVQLGFNENLARESMELFTLGVNEGYTQADVDALANILTGWAVDPSNPAGFVFYDKRHEPATETLLGVQYPATYDGGIAALTALATNLTTYNHIATQLVQHFVSDSPAQSDVQAVADALQASGGNLVQAATVLVNLDSAWQEALLKFRNPRDHVIAVMRAVGMTEDTVPSSIDTYLQRLGEPTWNPPLPNGWSDLEADWLCPAQVVVRTSWAGTFASGVSGLDPIEIAGSSVGPFFAPLTQQLMGQLPSVPDQFQLLFCAPEFQRR